jgi:hypothetical protein
MNNYDVIKASLNTKPNEYLISYMDFISRTSLSKAPKELLISSLKAILDERIKGSLVPLNGATLISTLGLFSMHPTKRISSGQRRMASLGQ